MSLALNAISGVASVASFTFFLIGCISFSTDNRVIENVSWVYAENTDRDVYYGLQNIFVDQNGVQSSGKYGNDDFCTEKFCDKCRDEGRATFGLIVMATIFSIMTAIVSFTLLATPKTSTSHFGLQISNIVGALGSAGTSLVGVSIFMGSCYRAIRDATNDHDDTTKDADDLEFGAGSAITTLGMLIMWLVVLMQLISACVDAPVPPTGIVSRTELTGAIKE